MRPDPHFHQGDRLPKGFRDDLMRRLRALEIMAIPPLYWDETANHLYVEPEPFPVTWARLIGAGTVAGYYAWQELYPDPTSGDLVDRPGGESGTTSSNQLRELNGNPDVPEENVECWRDSFGFWRFRASHCVA